MLSSLWGWSLGVRPLSRGLSHLPISCHHQKSLPTAQPPGCLLLRTYSVTILRQTWPWTFHSSYSLALKFFLIFFLNWIPLPKWNWVGGVFQPQTHCVVKGDLELLIFLSTRCTSPSPGSWHEGIGNARQAWPEVSFGKLDRLLWKWQLNLKSQNLGFKHHGPLILELSNGEDICSNCGLPSEAGWCVWRYLAQCYVYVHLCRAPSSWHAAAHGSGC